MKKKDIVIGIIEQVINEKKIDINSRSSHFNKWDSLANVNIALKLEKKFKVKIKASDMENMNSVKEIVKIINVIQ
jgi:acyl carrier protein